MNAQIHRPEPNRLLKIGEVARLTTMHRATIYRAIARGEFPEQIRLTPRRVGWDLAEIRDWIDVQRTLSRGTAGGTDENHN